MSDETEPAPAKPAPASKKHHYVPQFILRNFTNAEGKLAVRRHRQPEWRLERPVNVGHRNQAHSVTDLLNEDSSFYEKRMSQLEDLAAPIIKEILLSDDRIVAADVIDTFIRFIMMSRAREPGLVESILPGVFAQIEGFQEFVDVDLRQLMKDYSVAAQTAAVPGSEDDPAIYSDPDRVERWRHVFEGFTSNIIRFPRNALLIGDRLVCTYGARDGTGSQREIYNSRFGARGIDECDRVTMPLSPRVGLLLSLAGRPTALNDVAFNRATVLNSQTFLVGHPAWPETAPNLVADRLAEAIAQVEKFIGQESKRF